MEAEVFNAPYQELDSAPGFVDPDYTAHKHTFSPLTGQESESLSLEQTEQKRQSKVLHNADVRDSQDWTSHASDPRMPYYPLLHSQRRSVSEPPFRDYHGGVVEELTTIEPPLSNPVIFHRNGFELGPITQPLRRTGRRKKMPQYLSPYYTNKIALKKRQDMLQATATPEVLNYHPYTSSQFKVPLNTHPGATPTSTHACPATRPSQFNFNSPYHAAISACGDVTLPAHDGLLVPSSHTNHPEALQITSHDLTTKIKEAVKQALYEAGVTVERST